jgi:hypothetical protein
MIFGARGLARHRRVKMGCVHGVGQNVNALRRCALRQNVIAQVVGDDADRAGRRKLFSFDSGGGFGVR